MNECENSTGSMGWVSGSVLHQCASQQECVRKQSQLSFGSHWAFPNRTLKKTWNTENDKRTTAKVKWPVLQTVRGRERSISSSFGVCDSHAEPAQFHNVSLHLCFGILKTTTTNKNSTGLLFLSINFGAVTKSYLCLCVFDINALADRTSLKVINQSLKNVMLLW